MRLTFTEIPRPLRPEAAGLGSRRLRALATQVATWMFQRRDASRLAQILKEEGLSDELAEWLVERAAKWQEGSGFSEETMFRDEVRQILKPSSLADLVAKGVLRAAMLLLLVALNVGLSRAEGVGFRFLEALSTLTIAFLALGLFWWIREVRDELADRQARRRIGKR